MSKDDRLQLRMNPVLKDWFKAHSRPAGGMSRVVHEHVEELFEKKTGTPWIGEAPDGTTTEEDGAGQRGAGDPKDDRAGPA
jgi:hypothetical protein